MFQFLDFFCKQKVRYKTSITKTYQWRIKQLDHLERMLRENKFAFCKAISKDFEVSCNEHGCDISAPIAVIEFTRFQLREWVAPNKEKGTGCPESFELSLGNGSFNGSLILLFNPMIASISAGNPIIWKADDDTPATNSVLEELLPQYFEPADFSVKCDKSVY